MSDKKAHTKKLWIQAIRNVRANLVVKDHTRVCSAHFTEPFSDQSIPTIFPTKPKKIVAHRHPLVRIQTNDHDNSTDVDDEVGIENENAPFGNFKDASTQTYIHMKDSETNTDRSKPVDVGSQIGSSFPSQNISVQAYLPRMTIDDIRSNNSKVRFYTGFVNFQVFWLFFSTLVKHGAGR